MRRVLAAVMAICLLLGGCGARSYVSITPHIEPNTVPNISGDLTVANYAELKNAIVYLVEQASEYGTISLVGYSGSVEEDLRAACAEVTNEEPIGAYAVEYMSYSYVKVLANYEASLSITYSRTPEEIAAVRRINSADEYRREIERALAEGETGSVVETSYYSAERYDASSIVLNALESNPLLSVSSVTVRQELYPSDGLQRIVAVDIDYGVDIDELTARRGELERAAHRMVGMNVPAQESETETVLRLADALGERCEFLPNRENDLSGTVARDEAFTAYGAIVKGAATSEGYAYALSALLGLEKIECIVVKGRREDVSHCWDLVRVGGSWYHVDAVPAGEDGGRYLLRTDEEVADVLKWNAQSYPAANGQPIVLEPAEPTEDTAPAEQG